MGTVRRLLVGLLSIAGLSAAEAVDAQTLLPGGRAVGAGGSEVVGQLGGLGDHLLGTPAKVASGYVGIIANQVPQITPIDPIRVDATEPTMLAIGAVDPDEDVVTYRVHAAPANGVLDGSGPSFTYTPSIGDAPTEDVFWLQVDDGADRSPPQQIRLLLGNWRRILMRFLSADPAPIRVEAIPSDGGTVIEADHDPASGAELQGLDAADDHLLIGVTGAGG